MVEALAFLTLPYLAEKAAGAVIKIGTNMLSNHLKRSKDATQQLDTAKKI